MYKARNIFSAIVLLIIPFVLSSQADTVTIGFGSDYPVIVNASSSSGSISPDMTTKREGFLPNANAASRFLANATMGYTYEDIIQVTQQGMEDWLEVQYNTPIPYTFVNKVREYHKIRKDSMNDQTTGSSDQSFNFPWWTYHMTSPDKLRQRVAFALSQIMVISSKSDFGYNGYALGSYYDILMRNAFGNYRTLLEEVTYHPSMGVYLTHLNNPKTHLPSNRFPDENYAREVMQLFTIGLNKLNNDGTEMLDAQGKVMPTYGIPEIGEFAKIFTGMTWSDNMFWYGAHNDTSFIHPMRIDPAYHEPGEKKLLNNLIVPNRSPVTISTAQQDIDDALDNLFNHQNTPPFVCKFLIQRLVTSNPTPAYINRVVNKFINNGSGIRGDMKAVLRAILLDEEATNCASGNKNEWARLREPFIRYLQLNRAFDAYTASGLYRNAFATVEDLVKQKPLGSPSVFNFYQSNFSPIGEIEDAGLVAPEFQLANSQTIGGYINLLTRCLIRNDLTDAWGLFSGENYMHYQDEISKLNISDEVNLTNDDQLHILVDRLNLILAQGRVTSSSTSNIINALKAWPKNTLAEKEERVKIAIYLIMTSPEYLISR
jgi:uncharacterized protein (DUF1800 family)